MRRLSLLALLCLPTGCGGTSTSCQPLTHKCEGRGGDSCLESPECEWVYECHRPHCANRRGGSRECETAYCEYDEEAMLCVVRAGNEVDQCAGLADDVCDSTPECERGGCEKIEDTLHCNRMPLSDCEDSGYCKLEEYYSGFRF